MSRRGTSALGIAALALLMGGVIGGWWGWRRGARPPDVEHWKPQVHTAAKAHGVDPHLLLAMVAAESSGDERAESKAGARGLLQLMLPTAQERAARLNLPKPDADALWDPELNLTLGAAYFRYLLDRFDGEAVFAVAAYNAGPTPVRRWMRRALDAAPREVIEREAYPETRAHVRRVFRYRDAYVGP